MRSGILTRLDNGGMLKRKTGVASRYEFTNGEQYLANSKRMTAIKCMVLFILQWMLLAI